jgi:hypothetical protein
MSYRDARETATMRSELSPHKQSITNTQLVTECESGILYDPLACKETK